MILDPGQFLKTYTIEKVIGGKQRTIFKAVVYTDGTKIKDVFPKEISFPETPGLTRARIMRFFESANSYITKNPDDHFVITQEFGHFRLTYKSKPNIGCLLNLFVKRKRISFKPQELLCE